MIIELREPEPLGGCGCRLEAAKGGVQLMRCPTHAAAPEMYEALRECYPLLGAPHHRHALDAVRAAIAKAKGTSTCCKCSIALEGGEVAVGVCDVCAR